MPSLAIILTANLLSKTPGFSGIKYSAVIDTASCPYYGITILEIDMLHFAMLDSFDFGLI